MKTALQFEMTVDKASNSVHVSREFDANLDLVWDAWTKAELLDQWWAPKPYRAKTGSMDFRNGGTWIYCMISPENKAQWYRSDFREIIEKKSFSYADAFCDEDGIMNLNIPKTDWTNQFKQDAKNTLVSIRVTCETLADLEKILEMGFREGYTTCLNGLDELLQTLQESNRN